MLFKLDQYMLRNNLGLLVALLGVALGILLLERLIGLTGLVSGADNAVQSVARMIANLTPHYLGIALPSALFIATIISTERLSRSGEIVAMMATGISLNRIVRPYMGLAVALALVSLVISGFLQPVSRYNYRAIVYELRQSSLVTAFHERKFVQLDEKVIWTSNVDWDGRNLGQTFILERAENASRRFITGQSGVLVEKPDGTWTIRLEKAMLGGFPADISNAQGNRLSTDNFTWTLPKPIAGYRDRGKDQRELTLYELMTGVYLESDRGIHAATARADMHDRLARATLLTFLPLIGVVLGLQLGRITRSGGLVAGILLLVIVQKLLEYGQLLAERGTVPAWAGSWPVVALVAVLGVHVYHRTACGRPVLPALRRRPSDGGGHPVAPGARASGSE